MCWPLLRDVTLHIIAGARHEQYAVGRRSRAARHRTRRIRRRRPPRLPARHSGDRAAGGIAGTNIKILEAMAMGKAVVSTPAGVNGLDLTPGEDFVLVRTAQEMADAIEKLLASPADRARIEAAARAGVERDYSWDTIGRAQSALYRELLS